MTRRFDRPGRSPVIAENGMAATSHPLATASALAVLREGGNAVDAALAASATLVVVEPHMTGIGGDCFVILAEPGGGVHGLNGSGRAPAAADAARLRAMGLRAIPEIGPHAVTVPGAVKAWETLHARFGTLPFERLFADAIRYAEEGYAVHARVAADWAKLAQELAADEGAARHFLIDGKAPGIGVRHAVPALGATLRRIARHGAKGFYEGEIGAEMAATVQAKGGTLSEADLAGVGADWVEPISTRYAGHDILEIPPNGQGITALILLNLMRRLGTGRLAPDSAERYHLEIEAARLAYSVRDHMVADPAAMRVKPEVLLGEAYTEALVRKIDPARRNPDIAPPKAPASDTVYLTVVDRERRAVSFINSVYDGFGSKIVTPKSAIALQNRGACFSLEEGHPNELRPGKRPMHTIIPAMAMKDGRPVVSFGVMGGAYQPMGHAHVFSNLADHGMDPQEALDHARLFWGDDHALEAEAGIPADTRTALAAKGHAVRDAAKPHGGGQVIVIDEKNGFLIAGSDPRKDGLALGW
ncbi:gamma-glutamyltransferase family protein [Mesorhizobium sp. L-8-3]|uniref:gamma-glutamyltransferase family protein n=1 Tax=Mesorhizobium sp. L-8-3 TaxID=2744522 RepID=UPI00193554E2|nr:gamma-glutamyltransferase family protein [Mesorhizobium sp. L-8-3]BCH22016.1 gamma-glutamyltransferase [Mesorhizobium sp. L-8-3]